MSKGVFHAQPSHILDTEFKTIAQEKPVSSRCQWRLQNGETPPKPDFISLSLLQGAPRSGERVNAPHSTKKCSYKPGYLITVFLASSRAEKFAN